MAKEAKKGRKKALLESAREHQDALQAVGLSPGVIDKYENALSKRSAKAPNAAAQTLVKAMGKSIDEVQAAIRREFPGNHSFQSVFKAEEPIPGDAREMLALGRLVAKEMPDYATNLIKHGVDAASVKHLSGMADQLEHELGGADPATEIPGIEEQIREAARRAFEGKPELSAFEK
jgi:hypothetical protein